VPHGLIDNLPPKKSGMITNATYLMNVFLELDPARKRELQEHLTALLPDWFGQPQSNAKYAAGRAEGEGVRRGLLLLKWAAL
jgi:hypothetical protein